ncbi:50S ribosomal protein L11 methyltransferase [Wenyingzhuangia sp. 2_MG-2023]|uniref:50S ribosomal protein L11 methyltransferase n=1 Tax=Wenyingzhuangia sp. 2_MG-2023 TaxID=3062639 RepID=UPI0026E2BF84|nr:50S ribosomal protein L11 methyltransferase [Wenyingzhuangia sp. 2_MG-2023]MDO6738505.1 50S ribosomal protein L11 methyltransferase [Wenyingzhuangia sp. 2_MG-2023]
MNYTGYTFTISPLQPATEILIAELGQLGFESFEETETGLEAYIQTKDWCETILNDVFALQSAEFEISYTFKEIEQVNWNLEWEKNFEPIHVENRVSVIAPFHEKTGMEYEIVIEPKMSFGTGHHETTHLMIQHLLELDLTNKSVLDMGTGTGILAIFAEMKEAHPIDAIDIDEWCYINTKENVEKNNCKHITAYQGDASLLTNQKYDVIIANINRNILLNDMDIYNNCLNKGGKLLLSGFYTQDIPFLEERTKDLGLTIQKTFTKNNWVGLQLNK